MRAILLFLALLGSAGGPCWGADRGTVPRDFMIQGAEYFFGADPGEGHGTPIPGQYGGESASVAVTIDPPPPEETVIYLRFREEVSNPANRSTISLWSAPRPIRYRRPLPTRNASIRDAAYFVRHAGVNGPATHVTPGPTGGIDIPSLAMQQGDVVYLQVEDSNGCWSDWTARPFRYVPIIAGLCRIKFENGTLSDSLPLAVLPHDSGSAYYQATADIHTGGAIDAIRVLLISDQRTRSEWMEKPIPAPSAPIALSPPDSAVDQPFRVTCTWRKAGFATSYRLQIATDSLFSHGTVVVDTTSSEISLAVDPLRQAGTWYYWRVLASNHHGQSGWSKVKSFRTKMLAAPALVSPADSVSVPADILTFVWRRAPDATGYDLQLADDSLFVTGIRDFPHLADSTLTVHSFAPEIWHWWRVRSVCESIPSVWSDGRCFLRHKLAVAIVHPGDANDDGLVDARDILPIGLHYGRQGPPRPGGSLEWTDQSLFDPWDPPRACYADCDGNGTVETLDIRGIIQNWKQDWKAPTGQPAPAPADRLAVCLELLHTIDQNASAPGLTLVRAALVDYMRTVLDYRLEYRIERNRPNPFRTTTTWMLTVPEPATAHLAVYDLDGKLIWSTTVPDLAAGTAAITWDGTNIQGNRVSTGVYYFRLATGRYHASGKAMLLR